jgi:hypothetical protein
MRRATEHRPDYLDKRFARPQPDSCKIIGRILSPVFGTSSKLIALKKTALYIVES